MSHKSQHSHSQHSHSQHSHDRHATPKKGLHKDWRVWTAVVLMLAAMAAYIMTMGDSLAPEGPPQDAAGQDFAAE